MNYYLGLEKPKTIRYIEKFDEYGIIINGGSSQILIEYCPWCGKRLPTSKRNEWFRELEKIGIDDPGVKDIPSKFKTNEWYIN